MRTRISVSRASPSTRLRTIASGISADASQYTAPPYPAALPDSRTNSSSPLTNATSRTPSS